MAPAAKTGTKKIGRSTTGLGAYPFAVQVLSVLLQKYSSGRDQGVKSPGKARWRERHDSRFGGGLHERHSCTLGSGKSRVSLVERRDERRVELGVSATDAQAVRRVKGFACRHGQREIGLSWDTPHSRSDKRPVYTRQRHQTRNTDFTHSQGR